MIYRILASGRSFIGRQDRRPCWETIIIIYTVQPILIKEDATKESLERSLEREVLEGKSRYTMRCGVAQLTRIVSTFFSSKHHPLNQGLKNITNTIKVT